VKRRTKIGILAGAAAAVALGVTGCSSMTEPWNDAPVQRKIDTPAVILSMPDGFANVAEKCDESGNLITTTRDGQGGGKVVSMLHVPDVCPKSGPPLKLSEVR
jgi:hypothetical protein